MGEIADMMIDGEMCQMCGCFIDDGPLGYPGYCSEACKQEHLGDGGPDLLAPVNKPKDPKTVNCPEFPRCERRFRTREAAAQHWLDFHG